MSSWNMVFFNNMTLHVSCNVSNKHSKVFRPQVRWTALSSMTVFFPNTDTILLHSFRRYQLLCQLRHFSVIHGATKVGRYQVSTEAYVIFHGMHLVLDQRHVKDKCTSVMCISLDVTMTVQLQVTPDKFFFNNACI